MDESVVGLASAIGTRVRQERRARSWTLDQLADASGTSRRSLIHVEQGTTNPSVGILLKISDALGIGLPALVAPPEEASSTITRNGDAPVLWTGEFGGRGRLVAGTGPPDVVELWDWTMNYGDHHGSEAHADGTRELIHILAGAVAVTIADRCVELRTGDAMAFPGDVDHSYAHVGRQPARFALSVFEPGVGTGARKRTGHA